MTDNFDVEIADRLTRRRSRAAIFFGVLFLFSMATSSVMITPGSRPEGLRLAAWIVWAVVLLILVGFGGGLFRGKIIRNLMNDETTIENRRTAMVAGFWATVLTAFALFGVNLFQPLSAEQVLRLILTSAVASAAIRFGRLEGKSLKGG